MRVLALLRLCVSECLLARARATQIRPARFTLKITHTHTHTHMLGSRESVSLAGWICIARTHTHSLAPSHHIPLSTVSFDELVKGVCTYLPNSKPRQPGQRLAFLALPRGPEKQRRFQVQASFHMSFGRQVTHACTHKDYGCGRRPQIMRASDRVSCRQSERE